MWLVGVIGVFIKFTPDLFQNVQVTQILHICTQRTRDVRLGQSIGDLLCNNMKIKISLHSNEETASAVINKENECFQRWKCKYVYVEADKKCMRYEWKQRVCSVNKYSTLNLSWNICIIPFILLGLLIALLRSKRCTCAEHYMFGTLVM